MTSGKRPAGRPRLTAERREIYSLRLSPSVVALLDELAEVRGVSRSALVEEILVAAVAPPRYRIRRPPNR